MAEPGLGVDGEVESVCSRPVSRSRRRRPGAEVPYCISGEAGKRMRAGSPESIPTGRVGWVVSDDSQPAGGHDGGDGLAGLDEGCELEIGDLGERAGDRRANPMALNLVLERADGDLVGGDLPFEDGDGLPAR